MAGSIHARGGAKELRIRAVVTRADGRIENLGTISFWHRNPLKRAAWHIWRMIRGLIRR